MQLGGILTSLRRVERCFKSHFMLQISAFDDS